MSPDNKTAVFAKIISLTEDWEPEDIRLVAKHLNGLAEMLEIAKEDPVEALKEMVSDCSSEKYEETPCPSS